MLLGCRGCSSFYAVLSLMLFASFIGLAQETDPMHDSPGVLEAVFIYEETSYPECHASTIVETNAGLVAAWFGGTYERHPDVGIWVSRHVDGAWSESVEVANGVQYSHIDGTEHRHPCWNPVLHQAEDGPLMLFYKVGPSPQEWWGMLTISNDNGKTWSQPHRLPEGIDGPVKNKAITLASGDLLCPSSTEYDGWRVHLERSSDLGKTWTRIGPLNDGHDIGAIQPSILTYEDGRMQMLCRDQNNDGVIWQTWSDDNGVTWTEFETTGLPNPNAGTDAVTLLDGRQLLVYNHTIRGGDSPKGRELLNVAISEDGISWYAALVLEHEADAEFSYPAVIQTRDGKVHITYTWKRQRVRHVIVDPDILELRPIVDGVWP